MPEFLDWQRLNQANHIGQTRARMMLIRFVRNRLTQNIGTGNQQVADWGVASFRALLARPDALIVETNNCFLQLCVTCLTLGLRAQAEKSLALFFGAFKPAMDETQISCNYFRSLSFLVLLLAATPNESRVQELTQQAPVWLELFPQKRLPRGAHSLSEHVNVQPDNHGRLSAISVYCLQRALRNCLNHALVGAGLLLQCDVSPNCLKSDAFPVHGALGRKSIWPFDEQTCFLYLFVIVVFISFQSSLPLGIFISQLAFDKLPRFCYRSLFQHSLSGASLFCSLAHPIVILLIVDQSLTKLNLPDQKKCRHRKTGCVSYEDYDSSKLPPTAQRWEAHFYEGALAMSGLLLLHIARGKLNGFQARFSKSFCRLRKRQPWGAWHRKSIPIPRRDAVTGWNIISKNGCASKGCWNEVFL